MPWYQHTSGIQPGGDVGGDAQTTDSVSIRYHHTDRPDAVTTIYAYGIPARSSSGYVVEIQAEFMICLDPADPGGSEQWADAEFNRLPDIHPTPQAALTAARDFLTRHQGRDITWDGVLGSTRRS
jgi:hypothetical protein